MNLDPFLFWVIAGMTGACAIATVVSHNIVRSATWLLFTLGGTSGLFFLIGADLVGAIQLLVYVGGTMVLVVFGVMLTAQGPFISMRTSSAEWAVSAATGIALFSLLLLAVFRGVTLGPAQSQGNDGKLEPLVEYAPKANRTEKAESSSYAMTIGQGFSGVGVGPAHRDPNARLPFVPPPEPMKNENAEPKVKEPPTPPGAQLPVAPPPPTGPQPSGVIRTHYLFPFEIISVHLLVVLIAAAYLARAKRRPEEAR